MSENTFDGSHGKCSVHNRWNNKYGYCRGCVEDPDIYINRCPKCESPTPMHIEMYNNLRKENPQQLRRCHYCNWDDNRAAEVKRARELEEKEEKEKSKVNQIKEREKAQREKFTHSKRLGCLIWVVLLIIFGIYVFGIRKFNEPPPIYNIIGGVIIFCGYYIARIILYLIYWLFIADSIEIKDRETKKQKSLKNLTLVIMGTILFLTAIGIIAYVRSNNENIKKFSTIIHSKWEGRVNDYPARLIIRTDTYGRSIIVFNNIAIFLSTTVKGNGDIILETLGKYANNRRHTFYGKLSKDELSISGNYTDDERKRGFWSVSKVFGDHGQNSQWLGLDDNTKYR